MVDGCFLENSGSLYNNHPSYSLNIPPGIHTTKQQSMVDGCFLEKFGSLYRNHPSNSLNILLWDSYNKTTING
jgi:hypothetical protein